jgi:hypothetical protein
MSNEQCMPDRPVENAATVEIKNGFPPLLGKAAKNMRLSHISHRSDGDSYQQQMCYLCPGTRVTYLLGLFTREEGCPSEVIDR